ncbi:hypothetical protein M0R45_006070 [Rubus argutus]|uniref:Agglutinin domain-containing protein n=1 Tax=Rubus argutus TaxID=59490 RepID=A0AAW1YPE5_RUBAR
MQPTQLSASPDSTPRLLLSSRFQIPRLTAPELHFFHSFQVPILTPSAHPSPHRVLDSSVRRRLQGCRRQRLQGCRRRRHQWFLKFEGSEVATEEAKFEMVPSKSGKELVHLRCCYNNKYLVRPTAGLSSMSRWIVAAADKPEEDKFKITCTLFKLEPVNIEGLEFRFFHIQLENHACLWTCANPAHIRYFGGLHAGSDAPDKDVFNVLHSVAWESLVRKINKEVMPRFVMLKSMSNSKYLNLTKSDPPLPAEVLKFDGEEVASPMVKFEVEMAKIGNRFVHIRCCYNNKYLVRENTPIRTCCYNNKHWITAAG